MVEPSIRLTFGFHGGVFWFFGSHDLPTRYYGRQAREIVILQCIAGVTGWRLTCCLIFGLGWRPVSPP